MDTGGIHKNFLTAWRLWWRRRDQHRDDSRASESEVTAAASCTVYCVLCTVYCVVTALYCTVASRLHMARARLGLSAGRAAGCGWAALVRCCYVTGGGGDGDAWSPPSPPYTPL